VWRLLNRPLHWRQFEAQGSLGLDSSQTVQGKNTPPIGRFLLCRPVTNAYFQINSGMRKFVCLLIIDLSTANVNLEVEIVKHIDDRTDQIPCTLYHRTCVSRPCDVLVYRACGAPFSNQAVPVTTMLVQQLAEIAALIKRNELQPFHSIYQQCRQSRFLSL